MTIITYSLEDYKSIKSGYNLESKTMDIIQQLSNKFGVSLVATPVVHSQMHSKQRKRSQHQQHHNDDSSWESIRDFKPTVVLTEQNKTNDVRVALNKLSQKSYDQTSEFITEKIREIVAEGKEEDIQKIRTIIFDIISSNKMFAQIYAKFYKSLMSIFPDLFSADQLIPNFLASLQNIRYADPNTDYDNFCLFNKENDKRKSTALFISQLVENQTIPLDNIFFMTNELLALVRLNIETPDKIKEVEELTENIFIFASNKYILKEFPQDILKTIDSFSKMKMKEYPSITSRAIFKYADIIDMWNE